MSEVKSSVKGYGLSTIAMALIFVIRSRTLVANTAEGTPIYGMPVLSVEDAPMAVFCSFDIKPGYVGVPNPLYEAENVLLMLGNAKESVGRLLSLVK